MKISKTSNHNLLSSFPAMMTKIAQSSWTRRSLVLRNLQTTILKSTRKLGLQVTSKALTYFYNLCCKQCESFGDYIRFLNREKRMPLILLESSSLFCECYVKIPGIERNRQFPFPSRARQDKQSACELWTLLLSPASFSLSLCCAFLLDLTERDALFLQEASRQQPCTFNSTPPLNQHHRFFTRVWRSRILSPPNPFPVVPLLSHFPLCLSLSIEKVKTRCWHGLILTV